MDPIEFISRFVDLFSLRKIVFFFPVLRYDSTIPQPYFQWIYHNPEIKQMAQTQNFAANKTKKVAWFVSNCYEENGRLTYARELQKYIQVKKNQN